MQIRQKHTGVLFIELIDDEKKSPKRTLINWEKICLPLSDAHAFFTWKRLRCKLT